MIEGILFRVVYENKETKELVFKYITVGEAFPITDSRFDMIGVDMSTPYLDSTRIPIYENDILFVPCGWSGDYMEREHYTKVEFLLDEYSIYVDAPDDVSISSCTIVGNAYKNSNILYLGEANRDIDNVLKEGKN